MTNQSVFVIDDDPDTRALAESLLSAAGFEPRCFRDADLAVAALASGTPPAVVLFDVNKEVSGEHLYHRLHDAVPAARFIVISDATGIDTAAGHLGLVALRKPFDEVALVQVVKSALEGPLLNVPHGEGDKTEQ